MNNGSTLHRRALKPLDGLTPAGLGAVMGMDGLFYYFDRGDKKGFQFLFDMHTRKLDRAEVLGQTLSRQRPCPSSQLIYLAARRSRDSLYHLERAFYIAQTRKGSIVAESEFEATFGQSTAAWHDAQRLVEQADKFHRNGE